MVVKASISWLTADPDSVLITDTDTVITSLTGNQYFTDPKPALALLSAAGDDFSAALANAADGGKQLTALKNAKRASLVSLLRQEASYVTVTADGDMTKLLSSGFPVQKPNRTPASLPEIPGTPVVSQGPRSGEAAAITPPVDNAYIYNWRIALASSPTTYVQHGQSTAARITFDGLTPGQIYNIEANAVGTVGASDWSDAGTLMVV